MSGKYIKTFDYIRVVALIGVFLYHLMPIYVPSGYLGVVIFFVLAGFLTMRPILDRDKELSLTDGLKKIDNKILKLYPTLLIIILFVTVIMLWQFNSFLIGYPVDSISSILSVNNYAQILKNESYFEAMNSIKPLTHIWALSLEFQFYVLFYILVYPFYKKENSKKFLIAFVVLTLLSIIVAVYLVLKGANLTRIYYSVDSRLATFLIGVMCAMFADSFCEFMKKSMQFVKLLIAILLLIMVYAMVIDFKTDAEIIGIIIVYSILTGIMTLLLYVENNNAFNTNPIINRVIDYLVKRSYIIYLAHYPIIIFANRYLAHATININLYFIVLVVLIMLVVEILYRIINVVFEKSREEIKRKKILALFLIILISAIAIRLKVGTVDKTKGLNDTTWLTESESVEESIESESVQNESDYIEETIERIATDKKIEDVYDKNGKLLISGEELYSYQVQTVLSRMKSVNALIGGDATLTQEEFLEFRNMEISFIGDSVTQGAKGSLSVYFPKGIINAEGNRQLRNALPIFYEMKEKGQLGDVVVVALGTNSDKDIRVDVLQEIYDNLDGRSMIILTVAIPYLVEEQKRNSALRRFADEHDNCHIADWYGCMKTHSEYFVGDDTHPKGVGLDVYAQLIFKTAIEGLEWRKEGNEWKYYGSGDTAEFSVELEKEVGDIVEYGKYFINDDKVKEPIEWIIVNKDENNKTELLLSKYVLDRKKFNNIYASSVWQRSDIRKWLNDSFYNQAFESVGSKFLLVSALENKRNPEYKSIDADKTYDKVFLPSYEELKKYVDEKYLKCKGTEYFKKTGGFVDDEGNADWWTRTLGDADNHIMNVTYEGLINMKGDYVNTDDFGIRPMIKITYK